MNKKNILIVAYHFPPISNGGVQRILRLANSFDHYGYEVTVLCSKPYESTVDHELLNRVSSNVKVIELEDKLCVFFEKMKINSKLAKFGSKVWTFMAFPDRKAMWFLLNLKKFLKIASSKKFEIVFTSSGPQSCHLFGFALTLKQKICWIADYRDAWTNNPSFLMGRYPSPFSFLRKPLEYIINNKANYLTTVSDECAKLLINYEFLRKKIIVVPNGFDDQMSDFVNKLYMVNNQITPKYEITFFGSMYAERNPMYFLEAFSEFIRSVSEVDRKYISFKVLGEVSQGYKEKLLKHKQEIKCIYINEQLPYSKMLSEGISSALFLIIIGDVEGSKSVLTGKVFDYIMLEKPILALAPLNGASAHLIKKANIGHVFHPNSTREVIEFLKIDFENWLGDKSRLNFRNNINRKVVSEYSQTEIFDKFLKSISGGI